MVLSPQQLVSCDHGNYGCGGGYLDKAWSYLHSTGAVSDKDYPYTSGSTGKSGTCKSMSGKTHYKFGTAKHASSHSAMKDMVSSQGPCETHFTVYQDFFSYKSGVYKHKTGGRSGGHAVKLIGYGHENGQDYWLCANSWGKKWGLSGYFKIAMNDSYSNMRDCYAGLPVSTSEVEYSEFLQ